ncbi:hypothetical protein STTU_3760 [Streptomyces sp. Tu6071]|nr:hypothetical protein STTU_3760 [Streptomyces sp. Tu6071]
MPLPVSLCPVRGRAARVPPGRRVICTGSVRGVRRPPRAGPAPPRTARAFAVP